MAIVQSTPFMSKKSFMRTMSTSCMHLADVNVGVVPVAVRGRRSVKVHFHGFSDLDSTKDQRVESHPFHCFNHKWLVQLYPGGDSDADDGTV